MVITPVNSGGIGGLKMQAHASFNPGCEYEPPKNWIPVPSSLMLPELQFFFRKRPAGLEIDYDPKSTTPLNIKLLNKLLNLQMDLPYIIEHLHMTNLLGENI